MTAESQGTPQDESHLVKIGKITVKVAPVTEGMLIAVDLRRRVAEASGKDEDMVEVVQEVTKDLLINLVVDPDDIGKIITELAHGRVSPEELLEILTGIGSAEDGKSREERRRNARKPRQAPQGKRGGRRR